MMLAAEGLPADMVAGEHCIHSGDCQCGVPPEQQTLRRVDLRDPRKLDHPMSVPDLHRLAPHFQWTDYLASRGLGSVQQINVTEPKFVKEVDFISSPGFLDGSEGARERGGNRINGVAAALRCQLAPRTTLDVMWERANQRTGTTHAVLTDDSTAYVRGTGTIALDANPNLAGVQANGVYASSGALYWTSPSPTGQIVIANLAGQVQGVYAIASESAAETAPPGVGIDRAVETVAQSMTWTSAAQRSTWRRNSWPNPLPSEAPGMRPGTSATVNTLSATCTTPRLGINVVKG